MRRTEQEFKEELLKRTNAYRRERARKRKSMLGVGMCAYLCYVVLTVFDPFGAGAEAPRAADTMAGGIFKNESAMLQDAGKDDLKLESKREYNFGGGSPAENAAAPMAPETNISTTDDPGAAPQKETETPEIPDVSVCISSAVNTLPMEESDAQTIITYLEQSTWENGVPRCKLDCKILVNAKCYEYSSHCGVFFDTDAQQSLMLEEADRIALNEILRAYIPVEAEAPAVTILRESEEILLDAADSAIILDYLLSGEWIPSAANCLCDYTLEAYGEIYRYHSDCGTIQNGSGQSLPLTDADKLIFNEILQGYWNQRD